MPTFNFGPKAERFAMRPPELDRPINILEGAVRSGFLLRLRKLDNAHIAA
jgi:hypothetical protein